jgi:aryl-alcohol dehydrogenase-like predicted oxidoreductase
MKLALGTVQFGMSYGINNRQGKVPFSQVHKILEESYNNKIDTLDTAFSYGESEEIIGNTLGGKNWKIITKTPHFTSEKISDTEVKYLDKSFNISLSKLGVKNVYGLMVHDCDDLFKIGGELLFEKMKELKSSGLVEKIGVSVYREDQIEYLLNNFDIDIIQLPINVFDQRLLVRGCLKRLKNKNIEIYARSIFLQGLLLMSLESVPSYFKPIAQQLYEFDQISNRLSVNKLSLALGFVNSIKEIDKIVIGIDSVVQLKQIIKANKIKINPIDFDRFSMNNQFIDPSLWDL